MQRIHVIQRSAAVLAALALVFLCSILLAPEVQAAGGMNIQDGVLVGYYGDGGDVVIPNTVTGIAGEAFKNNEDIVSVTIPGSVQYVGFSAFQGCPNLEKITFSDPVNGAELIIRVNAFADCPKLTECEIPAVATYVTANVFKGCDSMTAIRVHEGNPYYFTDDQGVLFGPWVQEGEPQYDDTDHWALTAYPSGRAGSYTVPKSIQGHRISRIWAAAFSNAKKLTQVSLQDNIQIIGGYAFDGSGLTSMTIPDTVEQVDTAIFQNCEDLREVSLPSCMASLGMHCFLNCISLQHVDFSRCSNLTSLGMEAFSGCDSMTSLILPSSLRVIESMDLKNMKNLSRVYIPASVTSFPVDDELGAWNFLEGASKDLIVYVVAGSTGEKWKALRQSELGLDIRTVYPNADPAEMDAGEFTLVNMNHKTKLTGAFHLGDQLQVTPVTSGAEFDAFAAMAGTDGMLAVYRLSVNSEKASAPAEGVLAMGVPAGMKTSSAELYALEQGGVTRLDVNKTSTTLTTTDPVTLGYVALYDGTAAPLEDTEPVSVTLDKTSASLEVGKRVQIYAEVLPANAMPKTVTWSSSDTTVAEVSSGGIVTGMQAGEATITASTANGKTASCRVTVTDPQTPSKPEDPKDDPKEDPVNDAITTAVSLSAGNALVDGKAPFSVDFRKASRIATVRIDFETDGTEAAVTGQNGFVLLGDVQWQTTNNGSRKGTAYLVYIGGEEPLFACTDAVSVGRITVSGDEPSLTLTNVVISGWDADQKVAYGTVTDIDPDHATFTAGLDYDLNQDGKVDQLDLTTAQLYYRAQQKDSNWAEASRADFDGNGVIDLLDYVDLLLHFTE